MIATANISPIRDFSVISEACSNKMLVLVQSTASVKPTFSSSMKRSTSDAYFSVRDMAEWPGHNDKVRYLNSVSSLALQNLRAPELHDEPVKRKCSN
ncbi:hypothetical protein NPIL_459421 [Nephila pilipes]|uniref:Uncharacterized protein n=1 Tax=Nephila pilipes TaxID=299642 RepID=A0A8X6TDH7_NEPPI|nr:hypothetical protein NPIL_459421 [Nephila pilipes]